MQINFLIILVASFIPLVIGFIWYHPKVFGTAWMNVTGMTEEKAKDANMPLIFGLTFVLSFFLALGIQSLVIHQGHIASLFAGMGAEDPNSEAGIFYKTIIDKLGGNYRTFKHGVFHGTLAGFFIVLPIVAINALFERKLFKYIAINTGYFTLSLAFMGGVICAFS